MPFLSESHSKQRGAEKAPSRMDCLNYNVSERTARPSRATQSPVIGTRQGKGLVYPKSTITRMSPRFVVREGRADGRRAGVGDGNAVITKEWTRLGVPSVVITKGRARLVHRSVVTTKGCARLVRRSVVTTNGYARLVHRSVVTTKGYARLVRPSVVTTKGTSRLVRHSVVTTRRALL